MMTFFYKLMIVLTRKSTS